MLAHDLCILGLHLQASEQLAHVPMWSSLLMNSELPTCCQTLCCWRLDMLSLFVCHVRMQVRDPWPTTNCCGLRLDRCALSTSQTWVHPWCAPCVTVSLCSSLFLHSCRVLAACYSACKCTCVLHLHHCFADACLPSLLPVCWLQLSCGFCA